MRLIRQTDYRTMPWKNGAGTTQEIAIYPASSAGSDSAFVWRVSLATLDSDAPFSRFAGYDRLILLLDGAGMALDGGPLGTIAVDKPLVPMAFPGELAVTAKLKGGPCRDLNVMTSRLKARARLSVHTINASPLAVSGDSDAVLVYVVAGSASDGKVTAATGDTLLRVGRSAAVQLSASQGSATVALAEIVLLG
jgi:environmental stress-induced protein Ves